MKDTLLILICVYRSPSCKEKQIETECYDKLQSIIEEQVSYYEQTFTNVEVLLAGDLNCDADWRNMQPRFHPKKETLHLFGVLENLKMRQYVTRPTHQKSTIDVLCATCPLKHHVHDQDEDLLGRHHAQITASISLNTNRIGDDFDLSTVINNKRFKIAMYYF